MAISFDPLIGLPDYEWFAEDTKEQRDALEARREELAATREALYAEAQQQKSASVLDADPLAVFEMPKRFALLAHQEIEYRRDRTAWKSLFDRDREAERQRAQVEHDEAVEDVQSRLIGIGYRIAPPNEVGAITPDMLMRHPEVTAARVYLEDTARAGCHQEDNQRAIDSLTRQLQKLRVAVAG